MKKQIAINSLAFSLLFAYVPSLSYAKKNGSEFLLLNYNEGVKLYKTGDLKNSVLYFNNSLNLNPSDLPSQIKLGGLFIKLSKGDLAIASLEQALNLAPDDALVKLLLGKAYEQEGKLSEAITYYKKALALESDNLLIKSNLGIVCTLVGDFKCAVHNLAKVAITYPYHLRSRVALGIAYQSLKEYYLAKEEYKFVLNYIPDNYLVWYNLAKTQIALGEFKDALNSLDTAISLNESDVDLYLDRAFVGYKLNDLEKADNDYKTAVKVDPQNPVTYVEYGFFLWRTGAYLKAIEQFDKALVFEPDGKELLSNKAYLYQILNDQDHAISLWNEVLKRNNSDLIALFNLASLYQAKEDYEKAIEYYKKLSELNKKQNKDDIEAKVGLAYCLQKTNNLEEARLIYETLLSTHPNDPIVLFNYGALNIQLKNFPQVVLYLEKAIENNFSPLRLAYQSLIESYREINDTRKIEDVYNRWLDVDKGNIEARISYANFLARTGDAQRAIEQFRVAAALDSTGKSRYELARFLLEQKDLYGALGQLQEYLKVEPNDLSALLLLADLYKDLNITEQAINTYKKIITIQTDNYLAYYNLGLLYLYHGNGKSHEAQNYLLKAIELNEKHAPAYYALGLCYISGNENEKAKEVFQKYLELDPDGEYKQKAEEKLKELLTKSPA